jgi:Domain of unknown function (DUF427)
MGLSWQQGPLSPGAIGRFLVPEPLPRKLLYAEPLRRPMRVRFGGAWIADSENVALLFEPGHYPMAYFPQNDISADTLERTGYTTQHHELGLTSWYTFEQESKASLLSTTTFCFCAGQPAYLLRRLANARHESEPPL